MLLHEDFPHAVPMRARLVWKENWFWIFIDPDRDVCALAHATCMPTRDIAFASFTLVHGGKKYTSAKEVPLPQPFEFARELKLGDVTFRFLKSQAELEVTFENEVLSAQMHLGGRMPLFDFLACADVNPDRLSISEATGFALGQFRHQSQSCTFTGRVAFKSGEHEGKTIAVAGQGYRDHSWGMRNDETTQDHNWSVINFPDHAFHFLELHGQLRPSVTLSEGYVATRQGNRALKEFEIENLGRLTDGIPEKVRFTAKDYEGNDYAITCDLSRNFAQIKLLSQKPSSMIYNLYENMCPCVLETTGQAGTANVEIGWISENKGE